MQSNGAYHFGPFEFHPGQGRLLENGSPIPLRPKVFDLLNHMVRNPGRVISKDELLEQIWPDAVVSESTLTSTVSSLREALGDDSRQALYLETIPKRGYRFSASVAKAATKCEGEPRQEGVRISEGLGGKRWRMVPLLVVTAILMLGLVAGGWIFLPHIAPAAKQSIVNEGSRDGASGRLSMNEMQTAVVGLNHTYVCPAISPDGQWVAFSWEGPERKGRDIYLVSSQGGDPLRLTDDANPDWAPVWSPDGQALAFMRSRRVDKGPNATEIVVLRPFEGRPERIVYRLQEPHRSAGNFNMDWGPAGLVFPAFESTDDAGGVYLVDIETGGHRRLELPIAGIVPVMAAASPIEAEIALVCRGVGNREDVYLLDPDEGSFRRLTFHKESISGLSWAKGGREVIYSTDAGSSDEQSRFWAVSPHGGSPRRLSLGIGHSPRASGEGSLVYERSMYRTEIVRIDLSDGGLSEYSASEWFEFYPQISPDGRQVAFVSNRGGDFQIWIADHDGRQCHPLRPQSECSNQPSWSPDGQTIAFTVLMNGQGDIYVAGLDGSPPYPVSMHENDDSYPSWSADGKWIYFSSRRSGALEVWKSPSRGGEARQLTHQGGACPLEGPEGRFVYYQKPMRRGIWRATLEGLEETLVVEDYDGLVGAWRVLGNGIYYVNVGQLPQYEVKLYDFKTGQSRTITRVARTVLGSAPSLAVFPDGQTILLAVEKADSSEIVIAKGI